MARIPAREVIGRIDDILFGKDALEPSQLRDPFTSPATVVVELDQLRKVLGTYVPGIDEDVNQAARELAARAGMESWPGRNGWGLS